MFNKNTYILRREVLKKKIAAGIILFLGNEESPMNYKDNAYHFRQDSSFLYYFGISAPGLAAVIDPEEDQDIIFGDELSIDEIIWMGRQETLQEKSYRAGVHLVRPAASLREYIQKALEQGRPVHYLPPYRGENMLRLMELLGKTAAACERDVSVSLIKAIVAQRSIKEPEEVAEIEKAVNITNEMHLAAMKLAKPGMTENDVAAAVHRVALAGGGNISYPIILTVHGETLHNHYHGNLLEDGKMVLNDSGAETDMGYCGDLTRTFPVAGAFSARQKEIYNIVLKAKEEAAAAVRPGARFIDVHFHACKVLAQGLKDMGLMKGNIDEAVATGAHAMFFQCGLGHMMGLDVHDMEDLGEQYVGYTETLKKERQLFGLKSLRLGRELEPGFVLTIEPGVYIIPDLIDLWKSEKRHEAFINYQELEHYRDFGGIRIEDDYLITESGSRKLGEYLPQTAEEVEEIRKAALKA